MIDWEKVGRRIREAREHAGLTGEELGELIDRSEPMISLYETGRNLKKNMDVLSEIARVLHRPLSWFFEEGEDNQKQQSADLLPMLEELKAEVRGLKELLGGAQTENGATVRKKKVEPTA